jgi:hypothetical protein
MKSKSRKSKNKSGEMPCEICKNTTFLQSHHIQGRKIPNCNHWSNLVDICPSCHFETHHGKIIIEKWVTTTQGKELIWHYKDEESFTGEDSKTHIIK